jgi:hypothetical protein
MSILWTQNATVPEGLPCLTQPRYLSRNTLEILSWHILLEVSLAFRDIQLSRSSERKTMLSLGDYFSSHLIALVGHIS